jgi:hypothetical protein
VALDMACLLTGVASHALVSCSTNTGVWVGVIRCVRRVVCGERLPVCREAGNGDSACRSQHRSRRHLRSTRVQSFFEM